MNKSLADPEQFLEGLWQKIPAPVKWAFFSAVVFGLITHLYMFTNKLPNHDDVRYLFDLNYGVQSGRWFLPIVADFSSGFSMPWVIGVLSILGLALTACVTVCLCRIQKPLACVIVSALLVSFPSVAATFTYLFTADAYFFGLFLAALAAYTAMRWKWYGCLVSILLISLSLGIYQSYYSVTVVLMVLALIFDALDQKAGFLKLFLKGVLSLLTLILGMIGYIAAVRFTTRQVGLTDYMGLSDMGNVSPADIPALIAKCYSTYDDYFFHNTMGWNVDHLDTLLLLALLCAMLLLLLLLIQRRIGVLRSLLVIVLILLYPLAGNLIHLMVNGGEVHYLMTYGAIYLLVLPVALASKASEYAQEAGFVQKNLQALCSWIILLTMTLASFSYALVDNKAYLKMELVFDQAYAYCNRLVQSIESVDGYTPQTPIVFVGHRNYVLPENQTPELDSFWITGALSLETFLRSYSFDLFLYRYLGVTNDIYIANNEIEAADNNIEETYAARPEVMAMPSYPAKGSITTLDGYIIVKIADKADENP